LSKLKQRKKKHEPNASRFSAASRACGNEKGTGDRQTVNPASRFAGFVLFFCLFFALSIHSFFTQFDIVTNCGS
jgi:hypothetical protein